AVRSRRGRDHRSHVAALLPRALAERCVRKFLDTTPSRCAVTQKLCVVPMVRCCHLQHHPRRTESSLRRRERGLGHVQASDEAPPLPHRKGKGLHPHPHPFPLCSFVRLSLSLSIRSTRIRKSNRRASWRSSAIASARPKVHNYFSHS